MNVFKGISNALISNNLVDLRGPKILAYHSINDQQKFKIDVTKSHFEDQIKFVKDHYNVISLDDLSTGRKVTSSDVVLTFDDGFDDYYTTAFPFLQKLGLPSTVYIIGSVLNPKVSYNFKTAEGKKALTVNMLSELSKESLCTIGNHTQSHINLGKRQSSGDLDFELLKCQEVLREIVGDDIKHFCYPWGKVHRQNAKRVNEIFETAVIGDGHSCGELDLQRLSRMPVFDESLDDFISRLEGSSIVIDRLRHYYNSVFP